MARILAIDDEPEILLLLQNALGKDGHDVVTRSDPSGIKEEELEWYDLILLDIMMPGINGFELCRKIRDMVDCPILFLTARTLENDITFGFSLGADDYIKEPFSVQELRARVNAHLRREKREKLQSMHVSGVRFLLTRQEIYREKEKVPFTKSEYEICEFLARNHGQVFSKQQIYEHVFGYEGESDESAITEHVKNIRKKFAEVGINPLETVWGIGYRWE